MGGLQSAEIPGGGSEGYHVLRVDMCLVLIFMSAMNVSSLASIRSSCPSAGPTVIVASRSNRGRGSHSGLHVANTNKQC